MPLDKIALYVHIPFCTAKCDYCDFYSCVRVPEETQTQVILEILLQGEYLIRRLGNPGIETIFIGGGTPNALSNENLNVLVTGLNKIASMGFSEFTVEVNPESITEENLRLLKEGGVTRLSVGIQSFSDPILTFIGRNTTECINRNALNRITAVWENQLNIDLITEIPGQTHEQMLCDIDTALTHCPDHLSLYSLHIEEGTPLFTRLQGNTSGAVPKAPTGRIADYLERHGFTRYEVSNYSHPGRECRHNLIYWHMEPYLGLGPGAASTLPGEKGIYRSENSEALDLFLMGEASSWGAKSVEITPNEFLTEYLMMGLRLTEGISIERTRQLFGSGVVKRITSVIADFQTKGYADSNGEKLFLTPAGMDLLNPLILELMEVCEPNSRQFVNWP